MIFKNLKGSLNKNIVTIFRYYSILSGMPKKVLAIRIWGVCLYCFYSFIDGIKFFWFCIFRGRKLVPYEDNTIVFVKGLPRMRVLKQALGLKNTGKYKLILVAQKCIPEILEGIFEEIRFYKTRLGLARILRGLNPYIIHAQSPPDKDVVTVIKHANCPVVTDSYDVTSLTANYFKSELSAEKFRVENADGIIFRDLIIDFMKQKYHISCPVLHFLDYPPKQLIVETPLPKLSKTDGEIHIVYVGQVFPLNLPSDRYGLSQYGEIAEVITTQKIHFHIYPDPLLYRFYSFSCYKDLERKNPYFHFHRGLPIYQLNKEISQYDYGWWLPRPYPANSPIPGIYGATVMGNKFFTYLEAGLPIIVSEYYEYAASLTQKYNIGVVCNYEKLYELRAKLEQFDCEELSNNVLEARKILSMENQIHRLISFYEQVANKQNITEP